MRIQVPEFESRKHLFEYLHKNKKDLISKKRMLPITSEPFRQKYSPIYEKSTSQFRYKDEGGEESDPNKLRVKVVANTSNYIDNHGDMVIDNAPLKSIKERKHLIPFLHDHKWSVTGDIADVIDIYLEDIELRKLGFDQKGTVQALIFEADIRRDMNEQVFLRYKNGKVKQHSIGLQYIKLELAMNDEDYKEEFSNWETYYPKAVNKEVADSTGYFWIVKEYKLMENSAVLFGAHDLTPVLENESKFMPGNHMSNEPSISDTRKANALDELLNNFKKINDGKNRN